MLDLNLPLFDRLIDSMEKAVAFEKELKMADIFEKFPSQFYEQGKTTIHNCGSAACVMGYAALHEDSLGLVKLRGVESAANEIWRCLGGEIKGAFGCDAETGEDLADSIALAFAGERKAEAQDAGLPEELLQMTHLNVDDPTAQDALDYLLALKTYLVETYSKESDDA